MKIYEGDAYCMFYKSQFSFEGEVFNNLKALINSAHENINLHWITNLNMCIDHMGFEFVGQHIWATLRIILVHLFLLQGTYMEMLHS